MGYKRIIRRSFNQLGIDVLRLSETPDARLVQMLAHHGVDLVLDVGANEGQYAQTLRSHGYRGALLSFEPLAEAHRLLRQRAASDPMWEVAPPVALGGRNGEVEINVAKSSATSSLLQFDAALQTRLPGMTNVSTEVVKLCRLDDVAESKVATASRPFLKIDTQGYEHHVLAGAVATLDRVVGVQVELSLARVYEGEAGYREILDLLESRGFALWALFPGFTDSSTGRMLQVDGVLFRSTASEEVDGRKHAP